MAVNRDKPDKWKEDVTRSVDFYNNWFMNFAPKAFRDTRIITVQKVQQALLSTQNLTNLTPDLLKEHPEVLPILRMTTCPPIARDRLVGLAGVTKSLVENMENADNPRISPRMLPEKLDEELEKLSEIITRMADPDIFVWLYRKEPASKQEIQRAATVIADRLCGSVADPIIRNAQVKRQLATIEIYLKSKGYKEALSGTKYNNMLPGTYSFRSNVPVRLVDNEVKHINILVDVMIMPLSAKKGELPVLIQAKSAGDFTNVNKRRKEEAQIMQQLRNTYGSNIQFVLFLCGYFDSGYLGYEAAEGIDWIWEHRIEDMEIYIV